MNSSWKFGWIAVGCVAVVAVGVAGLRFSQVRQNPLRAFSTEPRRDDEREPEQVWVLAASLPPSASPGKTATPVPTATVVPRSSTTAIDAIEAENSVSPSSSPKDSEEASPSPSAKGRKSASETREPSKSPKSSEKPKASKKPASEAFGKKQSDVIGVLLLGIDTSPDREEKHRGWRSDVMIACAIDVEHNKATAVTIPRDTRAKIDKLDDEGKSKRVTTDKINAAYTFGGGPDLHGHENALAAVNRLLGSDIRYYASIDMDSIGPLADAVGGVTVKLEDSVPGVGKKGETVLLKGETASNFVRKRHGVGDGGDLGRTERQKQFLHAMTQKVKSENPIKTVPSLYKSMKNRVRTNLNLEQIVALATVLERMKESDLDFETIPGRSKKIDGKSYYVYDVEGTKSLGKRVFG